MRQGLDARRVYGQVWVEEVGQSDPHRLRDQPEHRPVAVEGPSTPGSDHRERGLLVPVEEAVLHGPAAVAVDDLYRPVAVPLDAHDLDGAFGGDPLDGDPSLYVLEPGNAQTLSDTKAGRCNGLIAPMCRRPQLYLSLVILLPHSSRTLGRVAKAEVLSLMLAATHVPDYGTYGLAQSPAFVLSIVCLISTVAEGVDGKQSTVPGGCPRPTARPS